MKKHSVKARAPAAGVAEGASVECDVAPREVVGHVHGPCTNITVSEEQGSAFVNAIHPHSRKGLSGPGSHAGWQAAQVLAKSVVELALCGLNSIVLTRSAA